ncbi:MAG: hypothetical protein A2176_08510 [Spirochaetes bacterium RBG_13_51_14]|nr:MAG: hypothetical protein A2176_08510 [Spirochaetes bacterium RBG_13_51_14]
MARFKYSKRFILISGFVAIGNTAGADYYRKILASFYSSEDRTHDRWHSITQNDYMIPVEYFGTLVRVEKKSCAGESRKKNVNEFSVHKTIFFWTILK